MANALLRLPSDTRITARIPLLLAGLAAMLLVVGCDENKVLGLSMEDQIQLGEDAGDQFEAKYGLSTDPRLNQLVNGIERRIAPVASPPNYPYEVRVLQNDEVNACAFPGGRMYVFTGLIAALDEDPAQLAFVIGHETAHVALGHTAETIKRQIGIDLLLQVVTNGKDARKYGGLVAEVVQRGYGRKAEYEADRFGLKYAQAAGYDPTAAYEVIHEFQKLSGNKDPSHAELIFDTHPGNNSRLNALRQIIERNGWSGRYSP